MGWADLAWGKPACYCKHDDGPSGFVKFGEILH